MGKVTSRMAYERKKLDNLDKAAKTVDARLFKHRYSKKTHELPPNTYRRHGITLPGKYYGETPLDKGEHTAEVSDS